jgi:transposase
MPKPYSADLRERVLLTCEAGAPPALVADRFRIGLSTVYPRRRQARTEGRREAKPHAGGPAPKVDTAGRAVIRGLVKDDNHATLAEHVERLAERTGRRISRALMCQLLKRLDPPRKRRHSGPRSRIGPR